MKTSRLIYVQAQISKFKGFLLIGLLLIYSGCARYSAFQKGQILYDSGKYPEAIAQWEKISAHDKNYLEAQLKISQTKRELWERSVLFDRYVRRGEQLEKAGDLGGATKMYKKAIEINPSQEEQIIEKVKRLAVKKRPLIAQASRSGEVSFKDKDYEKAKAEWKKVLRLDPDNPQAQQRLKDIDLILRSQERIFYNNAVKLYREGLLNAAKREFEKALEINPHNPETIRHLEAISKMEYMPYTAKKGDTLSKIAKSYTQNSEDAKILADFNNLKPTSQLKSGQTLKIPLIRGFRTAILKEESDQTLSVATLPESVATLPEEEPVSMNDKDVASLLDEGIMFYVNGDYEKALIAFEKVLAEDPQNYEASRYMALTRESLRETSVQNTLDKILERGLAYKERQEYAEAIAEFEKVINLDPNHAQAQAYLEESKNALQQQVAFHLNEGIRYFNEQQLEKAILEWDKVLALSPDNERAKDYQKRAYNMLEKLRTLQNSDQNSGQ